MVINWSILEPNQAISGSVDEEKFVSLSAMIRLQ